jgi:SNF2 family DNA or RNA helicase
MKADEKGGVVFSVWGKWWRDQISVFGVGTSFLTYLFFLQWTLDLIESKLHQSRISFARICVSMNRQEQERDQTMARFNTKGTKSMHEPRILLCSLRAACGGSKNLVLGNHVCNEATELQAMYHVHRHDRTRPVRVVRFVMNDSLD